jgi:hypothetical protein
MERMSHDSQFKIVNYFIDEAGDPVLFDRRGKNVLVGNSASKFFMIGKILVDDCEALRQSLHQLRNDLLADPYFRDVPSMDPARCKTALYFHARNDVAEVRREVFRELQKHAIKFYAVIRSKDDLVSFVRQQNLRDPNYRYNENELYDTLVRQLFNKLRRAGDALHLVFATRGSSDRTEALKKALSHAESDFEKYFGFPRLHEVEVFSKPSKLDPCLQACDYFLWALQRYYEKHESRYIELLWPQVGEINDLDKEHDSKRGILYGPKRPLIVREDPGA